MQSCPIISDRRAEMTARMTWTVDEMLAVTTPEQAIGREGEK